MIYLENVSQVLQKNVYFVAFEWNVMYISVKFFSLLYHLRLVFKIDFCLDNVSIDVSEVLKSPLQLLYCFLFLPLGMLIFALYMLGA